MSIDMAFLIVTVIGVLAIGYAIGCILKTIAFEIGYHIVEKTQDKAMLDMYVNIANL